MNARRIFAVAGATLAVLAVAGCPLTGLLPGPTTPTQAPFPDDATVSGRFTFEGTAPPQQLEAQIKEAVAGSQRSTEKPKTDGLGYFTFTGPTADKKYHVIWDDGGQEVSDGEVNTIGVYVSDPVTAEKPLKSKTNPLVTLDLTWKPAPKPAPGEEVTKGSATSFSFTTITNLGAYYQISPFDKDKKALTSSATSSSSPITLDTSGYAAGDYYYQIKFVKTGGTFGGSNFYGSTKYIKIKIK